MAITIHVPWDKYRSVLIDCDDTLLATIKIRWKSLTEAAHQYGVQLDPTLIQAHWGKPFNELIAVLLPQVDFASFLSSYQQVMKRHHPQLLPGASRLIAFLREQGILIEIITSSHRDLIAQDLANVRLLECFDGIWGYEETYPYFKPNPEVLYPLLRRLHGYGITAQNMLYIGDSVRDYSIARKNKIDFIAVTTGLEDRQSFMQRGLPEQRIAETLSDILLEVP